MKAPVPSNEACLAAELMASARASYKVTPYRAATMAADLCALGRRYKRLSERLCGGEQEWGRYPEAGDRMAKAERSKAALYQKISSMLIQSPFTAHVEGESLILSVVTRRGKAGIEERTALV